MALWVAIFPADVIKSRVQIAATSGTIEPTFRAMLMQVYREEGKVNLLFSPLSIEYYYKETYSRNSGNQTVAVAFLTVLHFFYLCKCSETEKHDLPKSYFNFNHFVKLSNI